MTKTSWKLQGTTALVTGAGRGLGAAIAWSLAENGCRPILAGRNPDSLDGVAREIGARHSVGVETLFLDLADAGSVAAAVEKLDARHMALDILINNGAMWLEASDKDHPAEDVLSVINSAITGTFLLTQGLLPSLRRSARPDVVTIGSISGLANIGLHNVSIPFYAAKRGQAALAEGFAQTFKGTPVRSLAIHPPDLDDIAPGTPAWEEAVDRKKGERATNRDIVDAVLFALTRPRHVTFSMVVDADSGGLHPG